MRRDSVAARLGEEPRALLGTVGLHAESEQDVAHDAMELGVVDQHRS
jgi:hypothetical protein